MTASAMRTRIKTMREGKGLSQSQMAEKLHMDERNYKRIENGEKKILDLELLGRIAEALETDVPELISNEVVNIEKIGDNSDQSAVAVGNDEVTINNTKMDSDLKKGYDELIAQMQKVIDEKTKTIALLMELQGKK